MELPLLFQNRMKELLGDEYEAYLASYDKPINKGLRVNPLKASNAEVLGLLERELKPVPWSSLGFYYDEEDIRPGKSPYFEAGLYYIQEPSAMSVAEVAFEALCKIRPAAKDGCDGLKVLDLCAAPGGKTTYMAALMKDKGLLVANEINPGRAQILAQNVERMGLSNTMVVSEDPRDLSKRFEDYFDLIIVDAPCSGEGMFRKEEDALTMWSIDNVNLCADRQKMILEEARKMLRSGGAIVYSTCTFAYEEDEGMVENFLKENEDLEIMTSSYSKFFAPGLGQAKDAMRLFPHKIDGEGHFACVLKDKTPAPGEEAETCESSKKSGKKKDGDKNTKAMADLAYEFLEKMVDEDTLEDIRQKDVVAFGENLYAMPCHIKMDRLKVLRAGLELGNVTKGRFTPSHALALHLKGQSVKMKVSFPADSKEINDYLKGLTISCNDDINDGWILVCADGYPIGWGKKTGNTIKNHYPKGLRWM